MSEYPNAQKQVELAEIINSVKDKGQQARVISAMMAYMQGYMQGYDSAKMRDDHADA